MGLNPVDDTYTVEQGDTIDTIALKYGLNADKLWEANKEELLKKGRTRHVLYPGNNEYGEIDGEDRKGADKIKLPKGTGDKNKGNVKGNTLNTFLIKEVPFQAHFIVEGENKNFLGSRKYIIKIFVLNNRNMNDIVLKEGNLENGKLNVTVPINAKSAIVEIEYAENKKDDKDKYEYIYRLNFNKLDPITETSGVQARLWNLGYYDGLADDRGTNRFKEAVKAFQKKFGLKEDGDYKSIKEKLKDEYGC